VKAKDVKCVKCGGRGVLRKILFNSPHGDVYWIACENYDNESDGRWSESGAWKAWKKMNEVKP